MEKRTIYRDSGTGRIISKEKFDKSPPNTVERERVRVNPKPTPKKGK